MGFEVKVALAAVPEGRGLVAKKAVKKGDVLLWALFYSYFTPRLLQFCPRFPPPPPRNSQVDT